MGMGLIIQMEMGTEHPKDMSASLAVQRLDLKWLGLVWLG